MALSAARVLGKLCGGGGGIAEVLSVRSLCGWRGCSEMVRVNKRFVTVQTYDSMGAPVKLEKPVLPYLSSAGPEKEEFTREIKAFNSNLTIEEASTPPSFWYAHPSFLTLEKKAIFDKSWQYACHVDSLRNPGDFYAGSVLGEHFVVVRGEDNQLRAFFNVCRHHATVLSPPGTSHHAGNKPNFVCCYHGWTYGLDGRLLKATKLKGIKNFNARDYGLISVPVSQWGPYAFVWLGTKEDNIPTIESILDPVGEHVKAFNFGPLGDLKFVSREVHVVNSNWKIVNDNYLDGEYHIPHVHNGLASVLELKSYKVELPNKEVSMQLALPSKTPPSVDVSRLASGQDFSERIGDRGAVYAMVYPNFAINRYGPMLDTNLVIPISYNKSAIIFDYFFEDKYLNDKDFIAKSIAASRKVQEEDTMVCELVQEGLESRGYNTGRYSPSMETPTYHFHQYLAGMLHSHA